MTTKKSIWDKTVDRVFSAEAELEACENTLQGAAMEIDRLKRAERNARALASKWRRRFKKLEESHIDTSISDYEQGVEAGKQAVDAEVRLGQNSTYCLRAEFEDAAVRWKSILDGRIAENDYQFRRLAARTTQFWYVAGLLAICVVARLVEMVLS